MDFEQFVKKMHAKFGLDLTSYKRTQLQRRINSLMARQQIPDYAAYFRHLSSNSQALGQFIDYLTINVTEFFRDIKAFRVLEEQILPELLQRKTRLKIWSAACSNGAEPYSLVMILEDLTPGRKHRIEATDLDPNILKVAARGEYLPQLLRNVSPERKQKYFEKRNGLFVFDPRLKKRVAFRVHDLLSDRYGTGYDLIVCRNVQIYFTREAQHRINSGFYRALSPGGVLFLGASESMFEYQTLGFERFKLSFYRKPLVVRTLAT
ncbi:MAG: protein-glutamate O-methyltransferase CheR [Peptococcaceae bacterium]|nr:protein-glutamate O-methyltransferase CheR [Peptococcaceae bacterium]